MTKISDQLKEELLSTSYLYRGRIINVRHDRVKIPGGKIAFREIVEHPGAVAILAFNEQGKVIMVRQHRQPAGDVLLEIPAGKLDPGEEPLECA
ncbi:MAG: NUDIX hydrolase, partial [Dethiobacteria bacterium]|nr:NUDIX hydrolase [Dethiobacteria bacterium]